MLRLLQQRSYLVTLGMNITKARLNYTKIWYFILQKTAPVGVPNKRKEKLSYQDLNFIFVIKMKKTVPNFQN